MLDLSTPFQTTVHANSKSRRGLVPLVPNYGHGKETRREGGEPHLQGWRLISKGGNGRGIIKQKEKEKEKQKQDTGGVEGIARAIPRARV